MSPKVFPAQQASSKQGIDSSHFLRDLSPIVGRTSRDTPVLPRTQWNADQNAFQLQFVELVSTKLELCAVSRKSVMALESVD